MQVPIREDCPKSPMSPCAAAYTQQRPRHWPATAAGAATTATVAEHSLRSSMWCALACTHSAFVVVHCRRYGRAKLFAEEVIRDYAAAQPAFRAAILRCVRAAVCRTYALPPNGAGGERTAGRAGPTGGEGRLLGHSQRAKSAVGAVLTGISTSSAAPTRSKWAKRSGRTCGRTHASCGL